MKTEKILEILTKYTAGLEEAEEIQKVVASRQKAPDLTPSLMLANLMIDLREDIAAAGMKASGRGSILSACKRILKTAGKSAREKFSRAWTGQDGRQYFCSGFHGVALVSPLDAPTQSPEESSDNGALERQITATPAGCIPVDLPPLAMVKTHIKLCKASGECEGSGKAVIWDFGPGIGIVNAQYLADILEALPGTRASSAPDTDITPFFFQDEEGNAGILLPVHPKDRPRERTADRYTTPPEDLPQVQPAEAEAPAATEPQEAESRPQEVQPQETTTPETTGEPKEPPAADPAPAPAAENEAAADPAAAAAPQTDTAAPSADPDHVPPLSVKDVRFYYNGLRVNGGPLVRLFYSLDNDSSTSGPCVSLSCRDYSGTLPGELFAVENHTDLYTDYHDTDRATVTPDHPLYPYIRAAALKAATRDEPKYLDKLRAILETPERYPGRHDGTRKEIAQREARLAARLAELETLPKGHATPADLAAVARLNYAAETARRAEEEARQQAERERVLNQRAEGRRYIERIAAQHPHTPGAPLVRICWSEHPAFYSWDDNTLTLSVAAADIILSHYDRETMADPSICYHKTKICIEYTDKDGEPATYVTRYDLGDDDGGLVQHIRTMGDNMRTRNSPGETDRQREALQRATYLLDLADTLAAHLAPVQTARVTWAPWLTRAAALSASTATAPPSDDAADGEPGEPPAPDLDPGSIYDAVALLTEDQLEKAILSIPYTDTARADVARFLLQELARRDMPRALAVSRRWKADAS